MPITTAVLDTMAATVLAAFPAKVFATRYLARTNASAPPVAYGPFAAKWEEFSDAIINGHGLIYHDRRIQVLRSDRMVKIPRSVVTWTPTLWDEVIDVDGEAWRVIDLGGGVHTPFLIPHVRRNPS